MPSTTFNDTEVKKLTTDKTAWYTDPNVKGLRLCVTSGGTKTFWVNKWDPTAQKVRAVKIGQWQTQGTHCKWAKEQAAIILGAIVAGTQQTRKEKADVIEAKAVEARASALPTFGVALELMIEHKSNPKRTEISGKRAMGPTTIRDYRCTFKKHLLEWKDVPVDMLPVFEISRRLNDLQLIKPQAAQRAAGVVSSVIKYIGGLAKVDLKVPGLSDATATKSRAGEDGDIDMTIPLADRWADVMGIENEYKCLAMQLAIFTGIRARPMLALTWDRVTRVKVDTGHAWALKLEQPVKHQVEDREVVLGDDAGRIIDRLRDLRMNDCDWVFPSIKFDQKTGKRVHLFAIDKFGNTTGNVPRHYWMGIARAHLPLASVKWLALHSMKGEGFGMVGHYGKPTHQEQYEAANVVAGAIKKRIGTVPNVVTLLPDVVRDVRQSSV